MSSWQRSSGFCLLGTVYMVMLATGAAVMDEGSADGPDDEGAGEAKGSGNGGVTMITELPAAHNWTVKPEPPGRWLDVTVAAHLDSFGSVSEKTMDFKVDMVLIQEWKDDRLNEILTGKNFLSLSPDIILWSPHVDFANAKDVQAFTYEKESHQASNTWISPQGLVNHQLKFSVVVKCLMDLRRYPLDTQICTIVLDGFEGIRLSWGFPGIWMRDAPLTSDITSLHSQFQLSRVDLKSYVTSFSPTSKGKGCTYSTVSCDYSAAETCFSSRLQSCVIRTDNPECGFCSRFAGDCSKQRQNCSLVDKADRFTYTALEIQLLLQRRLSYHLLQMYIPSGAIVVMSWVSFWIDRGSVPARVGLGITTLLTMTSQSTRTAPMPQVSYARAVDVWLVACELFTCAVLLEFAFVDFMRRQEMKRDARTRSLEAVEDGQMDSKEGAYDRTLPKLNVSTKMDYACRVAFPIAFLVFNLLYWVMYLNSRDI
ncbi:glycine receptor subunit alpha-2-like [Branchiostoma lanceolatum]|uniref:glycine receptor subunit alpha-2-like n=1 Tax=Branchiostoma lanceolatum TaxID=7740 RepID=UPI0034541243